ncbi:MAG: hypothetical protein RQ864_08430 [Lutibacter sp.]|nr:hypothetical protein [Lutibacter sp.]MDT8417818.1 hypothetical protein [Lutibacter sp.]
MVLSCTSNKINDIQRTEEARTGLNITVKNAANNQILGTGITVIAKDGTYTEILEFFNSNNLVFSDAWERAGTYIVTVSGVVYVILFRNP